MNKIGLCKKVRPSSSLNHHSWQDSSHEGTEIQEITEKLRGVDATQTETSIDKSDGSKLASSLNNSDFDLEMVKSIERDPFDVLGIGHLALRLTQGFFMYTFFIAAIIMLVCGILDFRTSAQGYDDLKFYSKLSALNTDASSSICI